MIFVDSGFLLALAQPTDALHERAGAWARNLCDPLLLTEYVLWEVVTSQLKLHSDRASRAFPMLF